MVCTWSNGMVHCVDSIGGVAVIRWMRTPDPRFHLAGRSALVHFETCAKIEVETPNGGIKRVTPKANVFQRRLYEAYEVLVSVGVPWIRILGLKIRQCGGTTCACHIMYHHHQRFVSGSVVIANVGANSQAILTKMKVFSETDRFPWNNPLVPGETKLRWRNGSKAEITSAETMNPGISRTRSAALFSEACKYPRGGVKDDKKIMASVLPSVNKLGIAESTPEGASGWFFEQWHGTKDMPAALSLDDYLAELKAGNPSPGNGWVKVFAAWFEFEENQRPVSASERQRILSTLTTREQNGIKNYNWTVEQMAWRRDTLAEECGGSNELFDEFYPEDDVSCFLSSGRPRFDMGSLVQMEKAMRSKPPEEGRLTSQDNDSVSFTPESGGFAPIQIFERPTPGCRYILWCDPATGEDQTESNNPDAYSIGVIRAGYTIDGIVKHHKVAARVRPPCTAEVDDIVSYIVNLSRFYGECMIVLEVNMGLHILTELKRSGLPIYKREVVDPDDRKTKKYQYGWKMKDRDQRRTIIDCLALHIRDQTIDLSCPHIAKEAKTFIVSKNGKEEARPGCHDDDVIGLGMGVYCIGSATLYKGQIRRRRDPQNGWKSWKG